MSLSNNLPEAALLLRQLGFVLMIEAQRYLVCVVLGFIAWIWWRRKAGSNVRLQSFMHNYYKAEIKFLTMVSYCTVSIAGKLYLKFSAFKKCELKSSFCENV